MPKKKRQRKPGRQNLRSRPSPATASRGSPAPTLERGVSVVETGGEYRPASDALVRELRNRMVGGDGSRGRIESEVVHLVNRERSKVGLPPLRVDERLNRAARRHSEDMAGRGFIFHVSPEGVAPADRMLAEGYGDPGGENVAFGQERPVFAMKAWMNSPGHRVNILNPEFQAIGVGVFFTDEGPWWAQNFGYR